MNSSKLMWTYMGNHAKLRRNWCEILFFSSVLSLNRGFELSSAAKFHVCQEKFHINIKVFHDFSEKISWFIWKEWYNSRRNCPATLRAGSVKFDNKKGPDRGQVQLSFASVILSWKEVKRRVVMFRHQSHKGRLDILNQGEGLSPIAYRRCSGS